MTDENKEQKPTIWHRAVDVKVTKVVLVQNPKKEEELKAIKFYLSDDREIMYYAKKEQTVVSEIAGFPTELDKKEFFTVSEFVVGNEMLIALSKNCKKKPQDVIMTFSEREFNEKIYYGMYKNQFETIYYKEFHGDNEENWTTQLEAKTKYEKDLGEAN